MYADCFTEEELLAFHRGTLPARRLDDVAEHLEGCLKCEATLQRFDEGSDPLLVALRKRETTLHYGVRPLGSEASDSNARELEDWPELPGYEVVGFLGSGGMGVIYRAQQLRLNRPVALKRLFPSRNNEMMRARLEAEAMARFQHPNIVQIHEVIEHEGRTYLALELVEGGSLAKKMAGKPQPPPQCAELVEVLARAVHYAHQRGIVHRDLKPANVLLDTQTPPRGEDAAHPSRLDFVPKITDFGIAKKLADLDSQTRDGDVIGTPTYMAPEQAIGKAGLVGPSADVYSLGVLLYEMLIGRVPLQGPTSLDTLLLVRSQDPVPPRRLQPRIPRDLETICLKCLRKQPEQRYAGAEELANDLRRFLAGQPIRARPTPTWERVWKVAKRRPAVAALSAAMAFVTLLGLALILWQWRRAEDKATEARQAEEMAETRRKGAQKAEARLALTQGQILCEQGDIERGVLWLARALERADSAGEEELDRPLRINLASWGRYLRPPGPTLTNPAAVLGLAFDPSGRIVVAAGKDGEAHCWNLETRREILPSLKLPRLQPKVWAGRVAFSPDGRTIAVSGNRAAVLWDAATHEQLGEPLLHPEGMLWGMDYLPDGKSLVTSNDDGTLRLWDLATRKIKLGPLRHSGVTGYYVLAIHPSGQFVLTTGQDGRGVLWSVEKGRRIEMPLRHDSQVLEAVFSKDGTHLFTATRGGTLHVWDLARGRATDFPSQGTEVTSLALTPDGRLLASGTGYGIVRLWNTQTLHPVGLVYRNRTRVAALAFSRDGSRLAIGMEDGAIRIVETPPALEAAPAAKMPSDILTIHYSAEGDRLLLGTRGGAWWADADGRLLSGSPMTNPENFGTCGAVLSFDGKTIAMGRWSGQLSAWRGRVEFWDAQTGTRRWQSSDQPAPIDGVAFSRDDRYLVSWSRADFEGSVAVWDVSAGRSLGALAKSLGSVRIQRAAFHPDGKTIFLACDDGRARLWDRVTDREIAPDRPLLHAEAVTACAFDREGGRIVTGCRDGTVRTWDTASRRPLLEPLRHGAEVASVAFDPSGRILLTGSLDGTARFWDAASGKPLGPMLWHSDGVQTVAFHPNGQRAASGGRSLSVHQWHLPTAPMHGTPEQVRLWAEVSSGMELNEEGAVQPLSEAEREERRRRLDGVEPRP